MHQVSFRLGSHCCMWDETIYDGFITQRPHWMKFSLEVHCHKRIEPALRIGSHCRMYDETIYDGFIVMQRERWINCSLELHCHKCIEPAVRLGSQNHMDTRAAFRLGSHYYKCIEVWLGGVYTVKMNRLYHLWQRKIYWIDVSDTQDDRLFRICQETANLSPWLC